MLLVGHMQQLYERKSSQLKFMAPLLLALRSLTQSNKDLKSQFLKSQDGLLTLFLIVSQGHGHKEFKNIYISGLILMCELEYNPADKSQPSTKQPAVFKGIIAQRLARAQSEHDQMDSDT
jgi:hypothetical protein